ncbi:hypothetical protein EVAR_103331_1 [Eumeta japonica]|uniref:Uncharacterized protein n=1 Tax=Eumeta variegata TaxID=151549 RepID=A0A4C1Z6Y8_EUMVA|nr:hypothetical protein EVAR_103331_1 [Eumeta japonica]
MRSGGYLRALTSPITGGIAPCVVSRPPNPARTQSSARDSPRVSLITSKGARRSRSRRHAESVARRPRHDESTNESRAAPTRARPRRAHKNRTVAYRACTINRSRKSSWKARHQGRCHRCATSLERAQPRLDPDPSACHLTFD